MLNPLESKISDPEQDLTHSRNNESSLLELQRPGRINQGRSSEKYYKHRKTRLLLIQETKMPKDEVLNRYSLFWKHSVEKAINSRGASGGIATFCKADKFNKRKYPLAISRSAKQKQSGNYLYLQCIWTNPL